MGDPSYYRARTQFIKDGIVIANQDDNEEDLKLLRNGFIPELNEKSIKAISKDQSNKPLSFVELTSYSTWFAMHPEKICGEEIPTSSRDFPLKIKGTNDDVIKSIGSSRVYKTPQKSDLKLMAMKARAMKLKLELLKI